MVQKNNKFDKDRSLELKGVAIVLMLFHHCFRLPVIYNGYAVSFFPFRETSMVNVAYASKICVSFFAFITGYGLFLSYKVKKEKAQKWVVKRYIKTFSGYWVIWVISAITCQIIDGRTQKIFFGNGFAKGIIYCVLNIGGVDSLFGAPTQNAVWWYMGAAIIFIISIPIIYRCKDNLWLLLALVILMPRMFLRYNGNELLASGTSAFSFFVPLVLGCIFARYTLFERIYECSLSLKLYLLFIVVWGIIFFYKIYHYLDRTKFWEIHYGLFPLLCIVFLVEYIFRIKYIHKPLVILGKNSLNIYLIHPFIQMYAKKMIFSNRNFLLITVIMIVLSLSVSIIIEWIKRLLRYDERINQLILVI